VASVTKSIFPVSLVLIFASCLLTLSCCQKGNTATPPKTAYDSVPSVVTVQPVINETSGIADSKKNTGFLWVQEDSGPPQIILLKNNGRVEKKIIIDNAVNRDWEDMLLSGNDVYIGEIGDNNGVYPDYAFYRFQEPAMTDDTIYNAEKIRFRYPDGSHDAEAFLVDPSSGVIYIITKRDNPSRIYKLTPPFSASIHVAEPAGQLTFGGVVSATLSPGRKEIIIKTYFELGQYLLNANEKIEDALRRAPLTIPYTAEPQGEAVCFSAANNGYFTMSEKGFASDVKLYFYKRQ
jgi:hypothetical protein